MKAVHVAQQTAKHDKKKAQERMDIVRREELERNCRAKAIRRSGNTSEDVKHEKMHHELRFIYEAPSSYLAPGQKSEAETDKEERLRREQQEAEDYLRDRLMQKGSSEKYIKLKIEELRMSEMSQAEKDGARLAVLKNAPVAGDYVKDMKVKHNPLGKSIDFSHCIKCGNWGHKNSSKECPLWGVKSDLDKRRQEMMDPMAQPKNKRGYLTRPRSRARRPRRLQH